jgi:hypothetical protein
MNKYYNVAAIDGDLEGTRSDSVSIVSLDTEVALELMAAARALSINCIFGGGGLLALLQSEQ